MNTFSRSSRSLIALAVTAALVAGCASTPKKPLGSEEVRAKLTRLQNDTVLAGQAPVATKDAEAAVTQAEMSQPDLALAAHRVYIADRKVETAIAQSQTRAAEKNRVALNEQGEKARLDARTLEADRARTDASQARSDADAAMLAASTSQQQAADLQRQLESLQAKPTDRGLVLTLGDTLFATGKSELRSGTNNLDRLSDFMAKYPNRTASIEGYTDSMGDEQSNQSLSERRADSVRRYLVGRGVQNERLSSMGHGENSPVADNATMSGRQQNRRVEVIISQSDEVTKAARE